LIENNAMLKIIFQMTFNFKLILQINLYLVKLAQKH